VRVNPRTPTDIPRQKGGVGILLGLRFDSPHHVRWDGERGGFHGVLHRRDLQSHGVALGHLILPPRRRMQPHLFRDRMAPTPSLSSLGERTYVLGLFPHHGVLLPRSFVIAYAQSFPLGRL